MLLERLLQLTHLLPLGLNHLQQQSCQLLHFGLVDHNRLSIRSDIRLLQPRKGSRQLFRMRIVLFLCKGAKLGEGELGCTPRRWVGEQELERNLRLQAAEDR